MNSERWQKIHQLLQEALALASRERPAFLSQACGGDEHLRLEVESLIASHNLAENFLEAPLSQVAAELLFKDQPALLDGQTIGCYEVLGQLGAGAMGEVYLAQDTRLGRKIALKLLPSYLMKDEGRIRRFEQEARSASALNHPNILTIHEIGQFDDHKFIATEFIQGVTLRERLRSERIPLISGLDICIQVAGALAAAHAAGIVHRDIKPENLMIRDDGYVKVLDFGLAKLTEKPGVNADVDEVAQALVKTNPGLVIGTIRYMSPEQARGLEVDARSDIFSLGVVLYEVITCRAPFDGETVSDVLAAILKEEPAPLKEHFLEVPFELEWIMKKALAKDREERYQTIREIQIDLKRLKQELELNAKLDVRNLAVRKGPEYSATTSASQTLSADQMIVANKRYRNRLIEFTAIGIIAIAAFSLISFYAGIKRAPAPSQPRFRQLTFRRGAVFGARFSPDGNTLIYSAAYDGQPVELFTAHLESPESSSLKLQAKIESISSTGEMAVLLNCEIDLFGCHNGTLARLPLVGGSPRQVMDHVYAADWGPNGQDLAVVRINEEEGKYQLEYPIGTVLYKAPGRIGAVRVSPNGDLVAFIDNPILGSPAGSVMVVNRNGEKTTLSSGWKSSTGLSWSSTGNEVWFSGGKDQVNAIYAVKMDGELRRVYQAPGNVGIRDIARDGRVLLQRGIPISRMFASTPSGKERDLAWFDWSVSTDISKDGQDLLFSDFGAALGGVPFAYIRKMDGSADPVKLGEGRALALSPDRTWALVLREGPNTQLVLLPTGVGQPRPLPRGDITEFEYASWLPDGNEILFTALDSSNHLRSYVQDISGGQAHAITEDGMVALLASPDGKQILSLAQGRYYLSPVDRSGSSQIRGIATNETPIQWSIDGRALYVQETGPLTVKIYRLDLATGRQKLRKELLPDPVGFIDFETRPGGIQITPDGKSYVYTYWTALRDLFLAEDLK